MDDAFLNFFIFFSPIHSYPLRFSPIQSDFFGVGLAFSTYLRFNDVDRKKLPLLESRHNFLFFEGLFRLV
jgi:hypothetical protein